MAHDVLVPPLGQTTDTVVLATWYRQAGDHVAQGEPLFAIETDKATLDIEAQATGILVKVTAQAGDVVTVLSKIGVIVHAGEEIDSKIPSSPSVAHTALSPSDGSLSATASAVDNALVTHPKGQRVFISPRAKRLAETTGITWRALVGTGPEGAIVERDVRNVLASASPVVSTKRPNLPDANDVERKVPYGPTGGGQLAAEVDVSLLAALRGRLRERGVVVTLFDTVLFVVTRAMGRHPAICDEAIGLLVHGVNRFDIGIITAPNTMALSALSREVAGIASGTIDQHDNTQSAPALVLADIGRFGLDVTGPLAVCGDAATLGVGCERTRRDGSHTLWVTLGYNRARLSDWHAAQFMNTVVQLIEDSDLLF